MIELSNNGNGNEPEIVRQESVALEPSPFTAPIPGTESPFTAPLPGTFNPFTASMSLGQYSSASTGLGRVGTHFS